MAHTNRYPSGGALTALDRRRMRDALVTFGVVVGVFLTVVGLIVVYLWLSWQRVYWADQVTDTRAMLYQANLDHQRLQADVATQFSLERVARLARQRGMIEPEPQYWPLTP